MQSAADPPRSSLALAMGKCRFNTLWLRVSKYEWVEAVPGNEWEAQCSLCHKKIKLGTMGRMALESHMKSAKHLACPATTQRQAPILQFCAANPMLTSTVTSAATTQPGNIRALCGSTPTLKAEVMWTLKMILDHHSYTSNENISKLFKVMFPDWEIAATFTCVLSQDCLYYQVWSGPFHHQTNDRPGQ